MTETKTSTPAPATQAEDIEADNHNGKLIIAIDELDKNHDIKEVKKLLAEIKGALSLPNCFYLLTLSEDCAQSFRQRLSAGRDIFESSFDEIFHVSRVDVDCVNKMTGNIATMQGGNARVLPAQTCLVIYLFTGGVAREVMRTLKHIYSDDKLLHQPQVLAIDFLQRAWQDWLLELVERPFDGKTATLAYNKAHRALEQINKIDLDGDIEPNITRLNEVISSIDASINEIDPNDERERMIWSSTASDEMQTIQRIAAVRSLIKLKIINQLTHALLEQGNLDKINQPRVLECFKLLEKQPYMAERLADKLLV